MVALYNYFKTDLEKCEYKLISDEVDKIDRDLEAAEKTLTWNSENMWDYVEGLRLAALDLNTRVKQAQANVVKIKKEINRWAAVPLFKRLEDEDKPKLLDLDTKEEKKRQRYGEIMQAVKIIQDLVDENEKLFKIREGEITLFVRWKSYLQYL